MTVRKSKKANLENKRAVFLEIGIIVTLSFVLLAFEWTTVRSDKNIWTAWDGVSIDEDMTEITIHKVKKPVMPVPIITQIIVPVDNDIDVDDDLIVDAEPKEGDYNDIDFKNFDDSKDEPDEEVFFTVVEEQPSFPGGLEGLYKYLGDNIKYPSAARVAGISGPVYVEFVVWKDGSIRMVNLKRGIGFGCDEEALRVLNNMPKWNPGKQRAIPVNVKMIIPVKFVLN